MKYILKNLIFLLFNVLIISNTVTSQNNDDYLKINEDSIQNWFDILVDTKIDSIKIELNDSIIDIFNKILINRESFNYPFTKLSFVGKIVSPDNLFRIINWNLSFNNGTYKYYGFIQYNDKQNNKIILYNLTDKSDSIINPTQASLTNENWYGALYYKVILNKAGKHSYYTLLGWDGNNDFSNKKIIDILYFTNSRKPRFGKKIFNVENQRTKRVIFEYNNRASLTLHFDEYLNMIVYEHLSPERPSQIGKFQFYIPDFSYDGLEFNKGKWVYHPDINAHDHKKLNKNKLKEINNKKKSLSF